MVNTQDAGAVVESWYSSDSGLSLSLEPATIAYKEALALFQAKFSADDKKQQWIAGKTTMADVLTAVDAARARYEQNSKPSKARKWLEKLAQRVVFYQAVFDTLTNGAPEYASFAWGALKFLCMAVANQAELISKFAKGVVQIADALPHIELRTILYPTEKMKKAVATLYAHIMEFMQRAAKWYSESKIRHAVGAIFKPFALSFQDILDNISIVSREIDRLAASASMAEQRGMHLEQRNMHMDQIQTHNLLVDVSTALQAFELRALATTLDTNRRVCEIQFSQIQTFTSDPSLPSPEVSRRACQAMRDHRRKRTLGGTSQNANANLLTSLPRLQSWAGSASSSLVLVRGTFTTRHQARDFAINTVDLALGSKVPTVWVLNPTKDARYRDPQIIDLLKQLVSQVLRLNHTMLDERSLSLSAARFQSATTEQEWFDLLGSVLAGLDRLYVVIDVECLLPLEDSGTVAFSFLESFQRLFGELEARGSKTVVKVVLVNYLRALKVPAGEEGCLVLLPKVKALDKNPKFANRNTPARRGVVRSRGR